MLLKSLTPIAALKSESVKVIFRPEYALLIIRVSLAITSAPEPRFAAAGIAHPKTVIAEKTTHNIFLLIFILFHRIFVIFLLFFRDYSAVTVKLGQMFENDLEKSLYL